METRYYRKLKGKITGLPAIFLGICLFAQNMAMAELPPVMNAQTFEVVENAPSGTSLGLIEVNSTQEIPFLFAITGGADAAAFLLNASTGELTVSGEQLLDYEAKASLTVTVSVSQQEEISYATMTINLMDVGAPVALTGDATLISPAEATIAGALSNAGAGGTVALQYNKGTILEDAFDPELAENKQIMAAGEETLSVQFSLTELEDDQIYSYRLVAKNAEGISFGETKSFTTPSIPWVENISIMDSNPTTSEEVHFLVSFTEAVNLLTVADFELELLTEAGGSGELMGNVIALTPFTAGDAGVQYIVTVDNISGDGTLKLVFKDEDTVENTDGIKIGGEGIGNGDYEEGEIYTIDNTPPSVYPLVYASEDGSVTYSFSVSDAPNDAEDLIVRFISSNTTLVPNDSYELLGSGENRKIRIIPAPHRHGETIISITVIDNAGNNSTRDIALKVVVRAVADLPQLIANDVSGLEDQDIALNVAVNLQDQDGSEELRNIKISGVPEGGTLSAGTYTGEGTYLFSTAEELNGLKFIPEQDKSGTYTFTLSAEAWEMESRTDFYTRKSIKATKSFTVEVLPVNDAPTFVLDTDRVEREEDFAETVTINLTDQSPDIEDDVITYSLSPASVDFANISINPASGLVSITSKEDAHGEATITVIANDGQAEHNEYRRSFVLKVISVNDAPVFTLNPESLELNEDFTSTHYVEIIPGHVPANEMDQPVSYSVAVKNGQDPIASVQLVEKDGKQQLEVKAIANAYGSQVFEVTAEEDIAENEQFRTYTAEFELKINGVNDLPEFILVPDNLMLEEDFEEPQYALIVPIEVPENEQEEQTSYTVAVKDGSEAIASLEIVEQDAGIFKLKVSAIANANGVQIYEVTANDGTGTYKQEFTLTITPVNNDHPVLAGELDDLSAYEDQLFQYRISLEETAVFTDPDGNETLTFAATQPEGAALPEWLSFDAASRVFSGTPEGKDVGIYTIWVKATDPDGQLIEDDFLLTVHAVNDAPEISEIEDVSIALGSENPATVSFTVSDEETPGEELVITVDSENIELLPASAISITVDGDNRTLTFNPPGFETLGSSLITVRVSDGEATATETFIFTVTHSQIPLNVQDLITPNNDQRNDSWNIRYLSLYDNNEVRVFDRNGRVVFEARNYSSEREWDGTQGGRPLPEGLYLYQISLNGGTIVKRGTLTIAR